MLKNDKILINTMARKTKLKGETDVRNIVLSKQTRDILRFVKIKYELRTYDEAIKLLYEKSRIRVMP